MKRSVVCLVVGVLFVWSGMAQEEQRLFRIVHTQVIPSMVDEWVELQKEYVAGAKQAGLPGRGVWQTVIGPTHQFTLVMSIDDYGYFDPDRSRPTALSPEDGQKWLTRIRKCVASRNVSVQMVLPALQIPREIEGSRVQYVTFLENQPNRGRELHVLLKDEVLPAYEKAGHKGVFVGRSVAGGQGRVFVFRRVGKSFKSLGSPWIWGPVLEALGEEKGRALIDRVSPLIKSYETHGAVWREDLAFAGKQ